MLCGEETIPPTLDSAGPSLCGQRGSTVSSSHTTLKRDVESDATVSGTESRLFVPKLHFFHTSGTESPLFVPKVHFFHTLGIKSPIFVPVLEHHVPHSVLDAGVLLGIHLAEVE